MTWWRAPGASMRDFLGMRTDGTGGSETATKNVKGVPYYSQRA